MKSRAGILATPPPAAAVEIARGRIAAVALGDGGSPVVSGYAVEPLHASIVEPALNATNVHDPAALAAALKSVLSKAAPRARRVALVLPDSVAKVSLVRFDKVPPRVTDLDQLIRWQVRKAAPFRLEDAQVAWVPGAAVPGGGREFIVTVARRDIIESYERACDIAGAHAGIVDLATFNLINAAIASGAPQSGDWLVVHVGIDDATLAVVRGTDLVFFRNRAEMGSTDLADLVHQTAMYHEDRLGGGRFSRVVLAGAAVHGADESDRTRRGLEERLGVRVEPIDFRSAAALSDRIAAGPGLLDALAPVVGVLLRERGRAGAARTGKVA